MMICGHVFNISPLVTGSAPLHPPLPPLGSLGFLPSLRRLPALSTDALETQALSMPLHVYSSNEEGAEVRQGAARSGMGGLSEALRQ